MNVNDVLICSTCELLQFFVNAILFYDKKGSF